MPRFFFDYRAGDAIHRDDIGLDFDSVEAAMREAKQAIGEATTDGLRTADNLSLIIDIRTEAGEVAYSLVSLSTVLPTFAHLAEATPDTPPIDKPPA